MSARRIRVMIVDDDPDVRQTLCDILATDPGLIVVAMASDGAQAIAMERINPTDVILLDIRMPNVDGLAALEGLGRADSRARVIMLTTFGDAEYVRQAIAGGADGFLLKSGDPRDLIRAVHGTAVGESWLSPTIAHFVAEDTRLQATKRREAAEATARLTALTPRETDVARHVALGRSNAEIGRELFLSESTVKAYVSTALDRLQLRNRVELAALVWGADASDDQSQN
ncbi:MAG: hypothetical protein JWN96_4172 [Mycobacterium sp.]|nr:hypothetical protein [Mycobacterium sp.]